MGYLLKLRIFIGDTSRPQYKVQRTWMLKR